MAERIPFRGGRTCSCVVESLPLVEKDLQRLGLLKGPLAIFQLGYRGDVDASEGTHDRGGCTDLDSTPTAAEIDVWRLWGWTMQNRAPFFKFDHCHGWPYKCPHLSSAAQDQEDDWDNKDAGLQGPGKVQGRWPIDPWDVALRKRKHLVETDTRGFPIMADTDSEDVRFSNTDPQPLKPGVIGRLGIKTGTRDQSVTVGAWKGVEVTAGIGVEGLAEGEWVDVSWIIDWKKDGAADQKAKESNVGTTIERAAGGANRRRSGQVIYAERVLKADAGWTPCLRLAVATNSETAKVVRVQVNGWKVKA